MYPLSGLTKTKWILHAFFTSGSMSLQELLLFGGVRACCIRHYVFLNSIDVFIGSSLNRFCVSIPALPRWL